MRTATAMVLLFGASLMLPGVIWSNAARAAVTGDSTTWEQRYEADTLPNAEGFTKNGTVDQFTTLSGDGAIRLNDTNEAGAYGWWSKTNASFDFTTGVSFETRLKVNSSSTDLNGQTLILAGDDYLVGMRFASSIVQVAVTIDAAGNPIWSTPTGTSKGVDPTEFHTYRLSAGTGTDKVHFYVDGTEVALSTNTLAAQGHAPNASAPFYFGDVTGSAGKNGDWTIDYLRWTDQGAFSPVPEPTSGMMIMGGLGLLALSRRKRKAVA